MKHLVVLFSTVFLWSCLSESAAAVTFDFSVRVSQVVVDDPSGLVPDVEVGLARGSVFGGRLYYDDTQPIGAVLPDSYGGDVSGYVQSGAFISIGLPSADFVYGLDDPYASNSPITVMNNVGRDNEDRLSIDARTESGGISGVIQLLLKSSSNGTFSSTTLPGYLDLSDFYETIFVFHLVALDDSCVGVGCTATIVGSLDELSVSNVPAPAALPLLVSGFGILGLLGWRRSARST